ncbi:glucuronate isomerase [Aquirufa regiilacus]|uniref:Uronate isomerase n=1 Tax=Aquirufa regiilacus TaxID=3024868 RepID=A0ABU3TTY9_9BACT|nr:MULTISPECIES: glucuronate isomerase [unclassified Aquirufa]MDT8886051.1 glucuronate isomerase [Aquirufa sp. LEPPI-3A]MDU0809112.1 glucuronate isomerase [Aquirufa sp. LEOWEIH-7C]
MKAFLNEDFLLQTPTAQTLYHDFAAKMPIIDYHNHLVPQQIAEDKQFDNITQIWLYGDHYKWRAMRAHGVNEKYITGNASDEEKFMKWAETVPYTMRNPLYHWTHLELQRYFGVTELLNKDSAKRIYDHCSALLRTKEYSVRNLLLKMNVKALCTTDDPIDNLSYHKQIAASGFEIKVLPTFRPDKAMGVDDELIFVEYVNALATAAGQSIRSLADYKAAIKARHDFFHEAGCRLSDHGLEHIYAEEFTEEEIELIFERLITGKLISKKEKWQFKSAMLVYLAHLDHARGWTQQFHLGAIRNNNARLLGALGPDTGFDSIGDFEQAKPLSAFLNHLDSTNQLAKTILYNLNPRDNELLATMTGNFQDGTIVGKMQFGSGWWFLDQKDGMEKQINALSNMGMLSHFVGMLTDSRSFLSFPRHEYFRRILCNLLGQDVENGELPADIAWLGKLVEDISYKNASAFFNFE